MRASSLSQFEIMTTNMTTTLRRKELRAAQYSQYRGQSASSFTNFQVDASQTRLPAVAPSAKRRYDTTIVSSLIRDTEDDLLAAGNEHITYG